MKFLRVFYLSACLLTFPAFATLAQDQSGAETAGKVEIVTDQEAGTVTIVIDGQPVVTIDANGVHVTGNITYTGSIRDTDGHAE